MDSKTIWGNHKTSRWEFQSKDDNNSETLADTLLPAKEIKRPEPEPEATAQATTAITQEDFNFDEALTDSDKLGIVLGAIKDYIARDISTMDLESVLKSIED